MTDRTDILARAVGDPVVIQYGPNRIATTVIALGEHGEFVVPRRLGIQAAARFHWRDREYEIIRIEMSQLGDILHTVEVDAESPPTVAPTD